MVRNKTSRLSRIQTSWAIVFEAHGGKGDAVTSAQERLLLRYYRSILRYLQALVHDADVAEELAHDFVVRFLRGDFKQANPSRGRFRDLLKQALRNLAIDYWRRKQADKLKAAHPLPANCPEPAPCDFDSTAADEAFLRGWRKEITTQAARALARFDARTGKGYHAILQFKAAHAKMRSAELALTFFTAHGKRLNAPALRQMVRRAREKFADLMVAEVARSLHSADPDKIEAELIELELHSYCRQSMVRLRESNFLRPTRTSEGGNPNSA